jgi:DNA-binding protein HU-beta
MNKSDLINEIVSSTGLTKTKANQVIDAMVDAIGSSLSNGEKVTLVGFGTFETTKRIGRVGRNPKTGDEVIIPPKRVAKFRPGTNLLTRVNI